MPIGTLFTQVCCNRFSSTLITANTSFPFRYENYWSHISDMPSGSFFHFLYSSFAKTNHDKCLKAVDRNAQIFHFPSKLFWQHDKKILWHFGRLIVCHENVTQGDCLKVCKVSSISKVSVLRLLSKTFYKTLWISCYQPSQIESRLPFSF